MVDWTRAAVRRAGRTADADPVWLARPVGDWDLLDGASVQRFDQTVVKFHAPATDPAALAARLAAISSEPVGRHWLQPILPEPLVGPRGLLATLWPFREALAPGGEEPWSAAGRLLANLHRAPLADLRRGPATGRTIVHAGFDRLRRALTVASRSPAVFGTWLAERGAAVLRASPTVQETWVHGDFHLGQLAREPGGDWLLIDPDDSGVGDPAWDLGRPAALWAAGLLDDESWTQFVESYRDAAGPGLPSHGDPWPRLDLPARAAAIVTCVRETIRDPDSAASDLLLEVCRRMPTT